MLEEAALLLHVVYSCTFHTLYILLNCTILQEMKKEEAAKVCKCTLSTEQYKYSLHKQQKHIPGCVQALQSSRLLYMMMMHLSFT